MSNSSSLFCVAGKKVLITGGSRGIGLMIAKGFVEAGANVLLTSRSQDACQEAVQELQQYKLNDSSSNVRFVVSNLSTRAGCEDLASKTGEMFDNELHILINNAGTSWGEPISRVSSQNSNWGFDKVFDLNVKSIFYLTRACHDMLKKAAQPNDPARIVNIGSIAGLQPQQAPTHAYDASKAAVHQLTRKFASEFAQDYITVNALAPGFVPSRMSAGLQAWGGDEASLAKQIPMRRLGNEDDMAGACIYLTSKAGSWCTGVILNVDGGAVGAAQIPLTSDL